MKTLLSNGYKQRHLSAKLTNDNKNRPSKSLVRPRLQQKRFLLIFKTQIGMDSETFQKLDRPTLYLYMEDYKIERRVCSVHAEELEQQQRWKALNYPLSKDQFVIHSL